MRALLMRLMGLETRIERLEQKVRDLETRMLRIEQGVRAQGGT